MQQGVVVAGVVTPPQAGSPATPGNVIMTETSPKRATKPSSSSELSKDVVMTPAEEKPTLPLAPAGSTSAGSTSKDTVMAAPSSSSAGPSEGDVVMAQPVNSGSYDPMQQPSIPGINQLLRACFDATHVKEHGTP